MEKTNGISLEAFDLYHKIKSYEEHIISFHHAKIHSNNLDPFKAHADEVRELINKARELGLEKYVLFSKPIKELEEAYKEYL